MKILPDLTLSPRSSIQYSLKHFITNKQQQFNSATYDSPDVLTTFPGSDSISISGDHYMIDKLGI